MTKSKPLQLCLHIIPEKGFYGIGRYGEKLAVNSDAHSLLAFSHAEHASKLNLILKVVLLYKTSQLFNNLS